MKIPIITIVTPSFNQGRFIEETIRTVLYQKGNFYIDYIVMDGGSTDNSVEIIKKYEKLLAENCQIQEKDGLPWYVKKEEDFPWNNCLGISYRWKSEKDKGQVEALKKGFRMAKGDIYCWLNSDDLYVNPEVLQKVCAYFDEDPNLELLTGDGHFISITGVALKIHHVDQLDLRELLYLDYHILQPSTFFSKNIYQEDHLKDKYTCAFDVDFFLHKLYDGVAYKKVNDNFSAYRFYDEIKTLALSHIGYKEQIKIAWGYSKNIYYILISMLYRFVGKGRNVRYDRPQRFVDKLLLVFKRVCYLLILGKFGRYHEKEKYPGRLSP